MRPLTLSFPLSFLQALLEGRHRGGRLILADALSCTEQEYSPKEIVDLATLTGAKMGARPTVAAVMGNSRQLNSKLIAKGVSGQDRLWEQPLPDEYMAMIKSVRANLRNVASKDKRESGFIIGGLPPKTSSNPLRGHT